MEELEAQLDGALELAKMAKTKFLAHPIVKGGPSPWFRIWNEATQNVVRLNRAIRQSGGSVDRSLDEELEDLLEK